MLKKQFYFVFGFVFVFVAGQQRPSRPPKPPTLSGGSYSDYPGLFVNKNPIKTNIQQNFQNNVFSPRVSSDSGSSNVVRKPLGPIVIPAASSSYRSLPSNASPQVAPSQTSASSSIPRSGKGIPVSVVAAAELSQQNEKPKTPLKTGTDTWTPIGFTGDGKSFEISTARPSQGSNKAAEKTQVVTPQPVPYDTTVSKKTIGQQIIERQQQQPQQYDIFGFPIDNSPDPFANFFGMPPSNSLFGPMFSTSSDPFFGSFGGAVSGPNQGISVGLGQSGSTGNSMLQMMLLMQLLGGDAPDPPARGRGQRGRPGVPSSPMSALEQLIRMEEMHMRRQQQLANRNRGRPVNQIRQPSQRYGQQPPLQQNRYRNVHDTTPKIPKPTRTKSAVVLRPGSSPRRTTHVRESLHPAVLDRRNMPTTPAPATQSQEPVEREGPVANAQKAPKTPPFRQTAIERYSVRTNYPLRVSAHTMQNHQASAIQYKEPAPPGIVNNEQYNRPPMQYNEPSPVAYVNYGQRFNEYQQQPMQSPQEQSQSYPYQQQPNPYQQGLYASPMNAGNPRLARRNVGQNAVPRNIQQLVNNPLFQRRLRTAGATPGANPADVRADRADLMADRADNLQAMNPLLSLMGMGLQGGLSGLSPAGPSPFSNMFGRGGTAAGNTFGGLGAMF